MRGVAVLAVMLGLGCAEAQTSFRNPTSGEAPPATTLLTGPVACLQKVEVAAGGEHIRRATDYANLAVQRLNLRVARKGDVAPAISDTHCRTLLAAESRHPEVWTRPAMPRVVRDLFEITAADSLLIPFVTNDFSCGPKQEGGWSWGEPAYEDERGLVDCHESMLTFGAYLFTRDGKLIWKAIHRYEVERPPDPDEMSFTLIGQAPLGEPVSLKLNRPDPSRIPGE
ncbi:MAG: hypothetical protein AAGA56_26345 [Myxococcota bacterium]